MGSDIIQAEYDKLEAIADRFAQQSEASQAIHDRLRRTAHPLHHSGWEGAGASAFFAEMDRLVYPAVTRLTDALAEAQQVTLLVKDILQAAEEEAKRPFANTDINSESRDERNLASRSDRRVNQRIQSDERWRREPGGRGGDHFSYDWAGGAILERYMTGGGDWNINNDSRWTSYMQSNTALTEQLYDRNMDIAQDLVAEFQDNGPIKGKVFDETFSMEIENGEGIVGYQYLHGTNTNAGGFEHQGTATIISDGHRGYVVTVNASYTWNDIIDPNPEYGTDIIKSGIAEIITLGKADPYEIHIGWTETTTIRLDANGNPISIENA